MIKISREMLNTCILITMNESYPDKVLKDSDRRASTKASWQSRSKTGKPFKMNRQWTSHYNTEGADE